MHPVVSRFMFHLEKYVKDLSKVCNEFNTRENIEDLRVDVEANHANNTSQRFDDRNRDLDEKTVLRKNISTNKDNIEKITTYVHDKVLQLECLSSNDIRGFSSKFTGNMK